MPEPLSPPTFRQKIRDELSTDRDRHRFDDLCAWEDEMLAFANKTATALDAERVKNERLTEAALPLSRLPYPVSTDERTEWLTYQQRLIAVLASGEADTDAG